MSLAENSNFVKQSGPISPSDEETPAHDVEKTLTSKIVAVHVVYRSVEEHIHWFGQITSHQPGILEELLIDSQKGPQICSDMVGLQLIYIVLMMYSSYFGLPFTFITALFITFLFLFIELAFKSPTSSFDPPRI